MNRIQTPVTIINRLGLHARAATKFVNLASGFSSDVRLTKEHRCVDGKSIMGVMMLAASQGTELTLEAEGEDAQSAIDALQDLINRRFDEAE